jgi:hypothetical protein
MPDMIVANYRHEHNDLCGFPLLVVSEHPYPNNALD